MGLQGDLPKNALSTRFASRFGMRAGSLLLCLILAGAAGAGTLARAAEAPATAAAVTKSAKDEAAGKGPIEITKSASSWDNLSELFLGNTPASPFAEGSMFVMRGELRNTGPKPVHHVVLRYELLDEQGKVIGENEGFNQSAEGMRPDEEGKLHTEDVKPIPAGGVDSYRMVFFAEEVPRFAKQRVRVVEVHEESAAAATEGAKK